MGFAGVRRGRGRATAATAAAGGAPRGAATASPHGAWGRARGGRSAAPRATVVRCVIAAPRATPLSHSHDATALSAGTYVYRLTAGAEARTGRLTIAR